MSGEDEMTFQSVANWVDLASDFASIITALVALSAWTYFRAEQNAKRRRLEKQLATDAKRGVKSRSILGLAIQLGISEREIVDASYRSNKIERRAQENEHGQATAMWLAHKSG